MSNLWDILDVAICSIPVYSSLTCVMLMVLTYRDNINSYEKRIKFLLVFYFLFAFSIWGGTITLNYNHSLFAYLNPFYYLSLLLASVCLYHIVFYLTATSRSARFPMWHYLPPLVLFFLFLCWSFFVPYEVRYAIIRGNDTIIPEYKYYSLFSTSKYFLRIIYLLIYVFLCFYKLSIYSKKNPIRYRHDYRRYTTWLLYMMSISIVVLVVAIIYKVLPGSYILKAFRDTMISLLIAIAHIMLAYNVIRRNYLLLFLEDGVPGSNVESVEDITVGNNDDAVDNFPHVSSKRPYRRQRKAVSNGTNATDSLSRKDFEDYFKRYKPYLDPGFKITDLIAPLEVNRTYISRFINMEYGMNFNQYINSCRLKELDILLTLKSNNGKNLGVLVSQAGFGSFRSYIRARDMNKSKRL